MLFIPGDLYISITDIWMSPISMPKKPEILISINKNTILLFLGYTGISYIGSGLEKMFFCLDENKIIYDCHTTSTKTWLFKKILESDI